MNVFLDTNVLVAASVESHPHHQQAWSVLQRVTAGRDRGFISAHSLAETYAALTRMPIIPRIHPMEAVRIVADNLMPNFEVLPLRTSDYVQALQMVAGGGWSGARIYDALLICCARRCDPERIYTFNLADFRQLATTEMRPRILAP
ncbi:MAG TPA: PIN domain-containing protein [Candidatus Binataceae bacterium]|nr:PIN domain-containing protein [Candidatus Binataceae bacterium]